MRDYRSGRKGAGRDVKGKVKVVEYWEIRKMRLRDNQALEFSVLQPRQPESFQGKWTRISGFSASYNCLAMMSSCPFVRSELGTGQSIPGIDQSTISHFGLLWLKPFLLGNIVLMLI